MCTCTKLICLRELFVHVTRLSILELNCRMQFLHVNSASKPLELIASMTTQEPRLVGVSWCHSEVHENFSCAA